MQALRKLRTAQGIRNHGHADMPIVHQLGKLVDLVELHRAHPERYPHFLKSTAHGRFDILFALPGESLVLENSGHLQLPADAVPGSDDFLTNLDHWWKQHRLEGVVDNIPFSGGWFIYLGYELAAQIEPSLELPVASGHLPVAMATRFKTAVINDHVTGTASIVAEPGQEQAVKTILQDVESLPAGTTIADIHVQAINEQEPQQYLDAVERILSYIREGDVFQVNLSRPWDIHLKQAVHAADLYASLGQHNPSPFSGLASWKDVSLVSSSPERLVSVRAGMVETRPIAGTRPRGKESARDKAYSEELLAHPKERAEHIMLIDLERNDLGRICVPGSIEVNELMALESYAHVHHIVSNVRGQLRSDITPGQVIRAVFPGGTITGCPKVRCMEIIAELEQEGRGAYTGSMGYINRDGSMDLNILIRSMVCNGKAIQLRAGAGIVADSIPEAELEETRAKARGLLRSLGIDNA